MKSLFLMLLIGSLTLSCKKDKPTTPPPAVPNSMSDIEGKSYPVTQIGSQYWQAANLSTAKFRNGDAIPVAQTIQEWQQANTNQQPCWSYYNNDYALGEKYGKIYNLHAVRDSRGLAPEGWHIPNELEWTTLGEIAGGMNKAGYALKSLAGWGWNSSGGLNQFGFNVQPGGIRHFGASFDFIGMVGQMWTSSPGNYGPGDDNRSVYLTSNDSILHLDPGYDGKRGFYVRCVKD